MLETNPTLANATNLAAITQPGAWMTTPPGQWAGTVQNVGNNQPSISKAAGGAGVRHVCTGIEISGSVFGVPSSVGLLTFTLRDGASGAGTVLKEWFTALGNVAGTGQTIVVEGLNIVGSANTAMTLECTGNVGTNINVSLNIAGYSVLG